MKTYRIAKEKIHPTIKDKDMLPSECLYIKGWLGTDWDGMPGVQESKEHNWRGADSIVSSIEDYAKLHGFFRETTSGLGGKQSFLPNCNMRAYFSKKECSLAEAYRRFDELMYSGCLVTDASYTGYSEWTITGMDLDEFTIGGHDLASEFDSHMGEYVHLIIECK